MGNYDYDLFTIGAGSGGVRASRLASTYGAKVAIAEEYRVGGTCVIRGCVPKKLMVYASEFAHNFEDAKGYGWSSSDVRFDWKTLIANKDTEIDRLNNAYIANLKKAGTEIIQDRAIIKDPHTVHLVNANKDVTAERILVAVGGKPFVDERVPGHDLGITSNEVFHLDNLPKRVVVAGGGYIAVEFACIFNGLGAEVTLVYRGEKILRNFDPDVAEQLHKEMEDKGITIETNTVFEKITGTRDGEKKVHLTNGTVIDTDEVFWAIGRRPHTAELGLEEAGVALNSNGSIIVDAYNKSSVDSIYAVGDVTDRVNLTPVAIREGAAFAENTYNGKDITTDYHDIPKAVFSQPPIGTVGLTEEEALEQFGAIDVYKSDFRPMKNTLAGNSERTVMKLVVDPKSDKVVGCHMIGAEVAEMIQCVAIAVKAGLTKAQFDDTVALHPTAAEELVTMRSPSYSRP